MIVGDIAIPKNAIGVIEMLLMKKIFFDAIRSGEKTTTLRYWGRQYVNPGSVEFVRGLGKLRIDGVRKVNFNQLTDNDAQRDGFETLRDLNITLDEI